MVHKEFITSTKTLCDKWQDDNEPCRAQDWPPDSFVIVSWPEHVSRPLFNGDCDIYGPYSSVADAADYADDDAEIDIHL